MAFDGMMSAMNFFKFSEITDVSGPRGSLILNLSEFGFEKSM